MKNYSECIELLNQTGNESVKGVTNQCIINELTFFNLFDIMTVDVMHDLLEGVCQFEVKLFLKLIVADDPKKVINY